MRYHINEQFVLIRPPSGPLVPWLGGFAESFHDQLYRHGTIGLRLREAAHFSEWLGERQIRLCDLTDQDGICYLQSKKGGARHSMRVTLRFLMAYLRSEGAVRAAPVTVPKPIECCLADYRRHLQLQLNLKPNTVGGYLRVARGFMHHCFCHRHFDLSMLQSNDVIGFVLDRTAKPIRPNTKKNMVIGLRSFLRYVHQHAEGMPDLASQVPAAASWAMPSVPRGISPEHTEILLESVDRKSVENKRDYAILVLLARLGLRGHEIISLTLDDIDWQDASLTVTLKGGRRSVHPLTEEIGEAIADYLRDGRKTCGDRRLFLRTNAPIRGFAGTSAIGSIVKRHLEPCGIDTPTQGTHQFRHGIATESLRQGASLTQIADLLGHRSLTSTLIYAKADIGALHAIAMPWPGAVR